MTASISLPNDLSKNRPAADRLTAALGHAGVETRISVNGHRGYDLCPCLKSLLLCPHCLPTHSMYGDHQRWSMPLLAMSCRRRHWWFLVEELPTTSTARWRRRLVLPSLLSLLISLFSRLLCLVCWAAKTAERVILTAGCSMIEN